MIIPTQFTFLPFRRPLPAWILIFACVAPGTLPAAPSRPVTIAIVKDGSSPMLDALEVSFRQEVQALTAGRAELVFKSDDAFNAGWSENAAARSLDAALTDSSVDYVLALGVRITTAAAAPDRTLSKPVFGALVQESDLVPLPVGADGRTRKANFAVVTIPTRAAEQLRELRTAVPFASLLVLADEFLAPDSLALGVWRDRLARELGAPVTWVPLGSTADDALAAVPADAKVVYLLPAVRMDDANRAALLEGLAARKISVLSFLGQSEVEAGALAGVLPHPRSSLARRLAINFDQTLAGTPVDDLPLRLTLPPQLFVNEQTAARIGFALRFPAIERAVVVGTAGAAPGRPLTFTDALASALTGSYDLRAQQAATEATRQSVRSATGVLLPQVSASQTFSQIDHDRAAASGGTQPETSVRGGLGLSQVIFDDEAFTRVAIARESLRQANYLEQVERLDAATAAGQAYLQLLSAQASWRVAGENLAVTQRNLELAQLRQRVGTAGPEEGYRFESLAAQQRADLTAAVAEMERARVALNQAIGAEIGTQWQVRDVTLDDEAFVFTTGRVIALVDDRQKLDRFRSFAAVYAAGHSPDVAALDQGAKTQRLTADEKHRRRYTPKVSASVNYAHTYRADLAGPTLSEQLAAAGLPVSGTTTDRNDWSVGVTATLPLFTGGTLTAEARKARAEQRRAEITRDGAREVVMAQAQSSLFAAESAYAAITLSRRSAELAAQNLAVVQDKYERGSVSIVTLLDAQNSAFAQRQAADAAIYQFFSELLTFQRSLGWIEALATAAEREAWFREVEQAVLR